MTGDYTVRDAKEFLDQTAKGNGNGTAFDPRFRLQPFNAIKLSTTFDYLIKGISPRAGLAVVWGPPKCGKSFLAFDLMMHVALGWKYRGRKVVQGAVVYCALEVGKGFTKRVEAWRQRHLADYADDVPFFLLDVPVDLIADRDKLLQAIRAQLCTNIPAVVVIDTLNRALVGDENKSDDMARFIRAADGIREAFACLVVIVHHCGVQGNRPRGHTSLTGAVDVQIAVERDAAGNIMARVEAMKDGEAGAVIASRLEQVEVGRDTDGDPLTSCVIVPVEGEAADAAARKPVRMSKAAQIALRALNEAIDECGEPTPASNYIPAGARVTTLARWRDYAYRRGISASDEPRARQQAFKRASEHLIASDSVKVWGENVWVAR